jgi:octopine oxidase subunit A
MPAAAGAAWDQIGRVPDNRLAAAMGCAHAYDPAHRWLLPVRDRNRMASVAGVFLPGAVGGPCDPATAAAEGEIVARAILSGVREPDPLADAPEDEARDDWAARAAAIPDDTVVCACMAASARQVREAARAGANTLYQLGHWNLAGAGACRGRRCHVVLAALIESVILRARAEILTPPFEFPAVEVPLAGFVEITPDPPPPAPLQQDRGPLR